MSNTTPKPVLRATGIKRYFEDGTRTLTVLDDVDAELNPGEVVALVGRSGTGKSTLLHLLGLLDKPNEGQIIIDEKDATAMSEPEQARLRNQTLGFVFQHYFLLPEFNVLENLLIPARIATGLASWMGKEKSIAEDRAKTLLEMVELSSHAKQKPGTLSGGERQRVAVARAMMLKPRILLCDEPTGNLDPESGARIMSMLYTLARQDGVAALVVTHDLSLADKASRVLRLENGRLNT